MRDPRELRTRAGRSGDPSRDQHFLDDERVIERMVGYATAWDDGREHVLEIGPGAGALTSALLDAFASVSAIERDRELAAFLRREFDGAIDDGRLTVVHGDALEASLPAFDACIANLPYGVASQLIFRLLPRDRPLLVMVQREFGERMAAEPGTDAFGRLSVTSQHYGDVSVREIVPPGVFAPPPPVESAIVEVLPREPEYDLLDEDRFLDVARGLFTQRRKTIRNGIRNTTHISGIADPAPVIDRLPDALLARRPDAISPADVARIANVSVEVDR